MDSKMTYFLPFRSAMRPQNKLPMQQPIAYMDENTPTQNPVWENQKIKLLKIYTILYASKDISKQMCQVVFHK